MSRERTIIERLRHMENGHKENGMMYEAEVCFRSIERIEQLQTKLDAVREVSGAWTNCNCQCCNEHSDELQTALNGEDDG